MIPTMFNTYFRSAWRSIRKNKITSLINITGLSVGMTAAVLILLWVRNETSFDNYPDSDDIYRLTTRVPNTGWVWETTPLLLAPAIKTALPEIEKATRLYTNNLPVFSINGTLFYGKDCAYVDNDWFSIFHYRFDAGSATGFNENPFSIILSRSEAKKYFGNNNAVGQRIHIDSTDYTVSGVVPDAATNSSFQYKAFMPVSALLTNPQIRANDEQWDNDNYITFIKTKAGSHAGALAKKISAVRKQKAGGEHAAPTDMIALKDLHFDTEIQNSDFVHGNRHTVYIFSFLGFLLLLIACINYVNLTTAKASLRAKEVSIRKITGARRLDLFFQFIAESVLISVLSLSITLLLTQLCLPVFNELTGKIFTLPFRSAGLWKVLGTTLLAALVLNSIYPALLLSSFKPLQVFRGVTVLKVKDIVFRKSLVIMQFTISVVLITGTIIIYRQMHYIQKTDPGYNRSQIISFYLPAAAAGNADRPLLMQAIKQDLLSQSSIESVTTSNQPAVHIGSACTECADWQGHDTSYKPKIAQLSADADFQKTMQLQMKEGRWFRQDDAINHVFILNETAVRDFGMPGPAVGKTFIFKGDTGQIIGVVKDFTYKSMHEKMGPLVVFNRPGFRNQFAVRTNAGNAAAGLAAVQQTWKKLIPGIPLEYNFMDDTFNAMYKQDLQTSFLVFVFAGVAIFISALGLFSLAAFEAAHRTKEIGIRKVLGATVTGIMALLSKDFIKLVALAILFASPIAWWTMNRWLQDFAYRISISWWMFGMAGMFALLVALATISFQAVKAAMKNPAKSLRTE